MALSLESGGEAWSAMERLLECHLDVNLALWRGRAGTRPGSRLPFLVAPRKGSQRGRWNTSFRAFCSGASAANPPHAHCLQLHRDRTRHGRAGPASARFASLHTSSPRRKPGPTAPVGTGFRRCDTGVAREQSEQRPEAHATGRQAQRSAHQATTRARVSRATRGSSGGPALAP